MGKGNMVAGSSKQFRWTKQMERMFLEILTEEATNLNNPTSTFRSSSFNRVASTISEKLNVQCEHKHVENHLKTVKNTWMTICMLKEKSGFGWDENMKMITCDQSTYDEIVTAHPKYEMLLNKNIDYYDEMAAVAGRDVAIGRFAKSNQDAEMEDTNDVVDITTETIPNQSFGDAKGKTSSSTVDSSQRATRKRKADDLVIEGLVAEIGNVAKAISKFNKVDDQKMYAKLMALGEGYDEEELGNAFEFLTRNEIEARIFNAKNDRLKKIWIDNFLMNQLD